MPKRLLLTPHLPLDDLETRYRRAHDPVERSHYQIIWLLAQGHPTEHVARNTGYSANWIRAIAKRYNQEGPAGLGDRRHHNPGGKPLLSDQDRAALDVALDGPAPDGGLWTSQKVADWMSERLGRKVHVPRGWEMLRRLERRHRVPRPRHAKADATTQAAFKKSSRP
jgi:transposase